MRLSASCLVPLATIGLLFSQGGCQSGAGGASFLSLFGLSKKPLVIALVAEPGVLNPFAPHEKLRKAMSDTIERPVRLDLCLPVQLEPNLTLGFYDLAIVTPACYAETHHRERFRIIAVTLDESGRAARSAVLAVAANSEIKAIEDLRGKRVAFGPRDDARTHHAGLAVLHEHGIRKTDLSLELLPLPGSLKHCRTMRDVAQSVLSGDCAAGFIDEDAFDAFPQSADQNEPARDRLRVIARTMPTPEKLVIQSPKVKPETVRKVTDFLLSVDQKHPEALRPLLLSAYKEPGEELRANCQRLAEPREPVSKRPASDNPD
jgi:ABC-type phosphate/phosphonate transport system substrate-binding protein